jgi:protein-tyrosine phosphatase|tara:strand:+ start:260 stop:997 length:738 start_codon:yes stop_codon:yes gene_type:complete
MTNTHSRFVSESCVNFRDVGGYLTQDERMITPGLLYRSDSLHRLSREDADTLSSVYGVKRAIDLRSLNEQRTCPLRSVTNFLDVISLPIIDQTMQAPMTRPNVQSMAEGYIIMLNESGGHIVQAIQSILEMESPVVVFCTAGKDRTGVLVAVILSLLDVGIDQVIADYELSQEVMPSIRRSITQETPDRVKAWADLPIDVLGADGTSIRDLLSFCDTEFGGVESYAIQNGLSKEDILKLHRWLVK